MVGSVRGTKAVGVGGPRDAGNAFSSHRTAFRSAPGNYVRRTGRSRSSTPVEHHRRSRCENRSVSFFSDMEPRDDTVREPEPRRVRWRGEPDDTVGVPVAIGPLVVQNDQVAIVVSGFIAYPAGFTFSLVIISRLNPAPLPLGHGHPGMRGRRDATGGELRFGLGFADGSKVVNPFPHPLTRGEAPTRLLRSRGGGGDSRKWSQEYWCEPLPPKGPMLVVFEWGDYGVPETSLDLDATALLDAATEATPLWPQDVDLPDDPDAPSGRSGLGWRTSSFGRVSP